MKPDFRALMLEATRLTRSGDLKAATAAIRTALAGAPEASATAWTTADSANDPAVIDVPARVVTTDAPDTPDTPQARAPEPAQATPAPAAPRTIPEAFLSGRHQGPIGVREYKLYIPPQAATGQPLPLIVMLHGCTQDPDDFAAGTRMNDAARAQGFFVLYPAQAASANAHRCWNWFKHSHQTRGRGEAEMLAGMTQEILAAHAIDPARVYVAGLSAGGAMAAILGEAYPDVFAAVGVHSGLPAGAATTLAAALAAMQSGAKSPRESAHGVPTIVFHGDADDTVHPDNSEQVIAAAIGPATRVETHRRQRPGGREFTRYVHAAPDGTVLAEHWVVHGSPHAWSGGSSAGSYTDPQGPDATAEMVRFFQEHPRRAGETGPVPSP